MLAAIYKQTITTCQDILDSLPSASQLVRNVQKVALPAIAFVAMSHITAAEAGLGSYLACMALCETAAVGATAATAGGASPLLAACHTSCLPFLAMPIP